MPKKKTVSLLLALILFIMPLAGCNNAANPRQAVELFQQEMNSLNYRSAFAYVAGYDGFGFSNSRGVNDIIDAVERSLEIQIINETTGLSSSNIDVKITTIDLRELYKQAAKVVLPEFYQQAIGGPTISEKEVLDRMVAEIVILAGSPDASKVTTDVTLKLTLDKHDKWMINLDQDSYAAITGYLDEANLLVTTGDLVTTTTIYTRPTEAASETDASETDAESND